MDKTIEFDPLGLLTPMRPTWFNEKMKQEGWQILNRNQIALPLYECSGDEAIIFIIERKPATIRSDGWDESAALNLTIQRNNGSVISESDLKIEAELTQKYTITNKTYIRAGNTKHPGVPVSGYTLSYFIGDYVLIEKLTFRIISDDEIPHIWAAGELVFDDLS
jgi:hypothetical protein